jgi:hypothetical protein
MMFGSPPVNCWFGVLLSMMIELCRQKVWRCSEYSRELTVRITSRRFLWATSFQRLRDSVKGAPLLACQISGRFAVREISWDCHDMSPCIRQLRADELFPLWVNRRYEWKRDNEPWRQQLKRFCSLLIKNHPHPVHFNQSGANETIGSLKHI